MNELSVRRVVRDEMEAQAHARWPRLSAIPCTTTRRAVDYLRHLPDDERQILFDVLEGAALFCFDIPRDPMLHPGRTNEPHFRRLLDATLGVGQPWDWRYADVRMLRSIVSGARFANPRIAAHFQNAPPEVLERAAKIVPIRAPAIRKLVKVMVQRRFGGKPEHDGGGDWKYPGRVGAREFVLSVDYGGWDQLRYEVSYHDDVSGIAATRLNYERLMGAGGTGWNALTADNAASAVDLIGELVEWLVTIPERGH